MEKKSLKDNLKLQVAHVDGSEVKTNDRKIHDFWKKKKKHAA